MRGLTTPDPASAQDYTTVADSTATGAQLCASDYNGPGNDQDFATSVALSPAGDKVTGATAEDVSAILARVNRERGQGVS